MAIATLSVGVGGEVPAVRRARDWVAIAAADVQVPVRRLFASVQVGMPVDAARADAPQRNHTQPDQQAPAEELTATLDHDRERPAEQDDGAGPESQQQGVPEREAHRDTEGTGALHGRRVAAGADRQRRDRHQVISAQAVKKPEDEG